jgi:ribonuclease PH
MSNIGTKERHLESVIHSTLRYVILTQNHPRTLIQVTLQVVKMPDGGTPNSKKGCFLSVRLSSALGLTIS